MGASIAASCAYGPGNNAKSCSPASLWRAFKSHAIHIQCGQSDKRENCKRPYPLCLPMIFRARSKHSGRMPLKLKAQQFKSMAELESHPLRQVHVKHIHGIVVACYVVIDHYAGTVVVWLWLIAVRQWVHHGEMRGLTSLVRFVSSCHHTDRNKVVSCILIE